MGSGFSDQAPSGATAGNGFPPSSQPAAIVKQEVPIDDFAFYGSGCEPMEALDGLDLETQMGRSESAVAVKRESPLDDFDGGGGNWGFSGGGCEELGDLDLGVPPLLTKRSFEETVQEVEKLAVKEEEAIGGSLSSSSSSTVATPLEGLLEAGPPPFLKKTFQMVEDSGTDSIISWSDGGDSFVVWDAYEFSKFLLPKFFKHNNFSSFIRQLNTYGFRKIDCDRWEFANDGFQEGKKHLLKNIKRRSKPNKPLLGDSNLSLQTEVETLKKDRNAMRHDIKKLRKQQEQSHNQIASVEERMTLAECRQQQILVFLSKATKNPDFVRKLVHKRKQKRELDSGKKHRLLATQATDANHDNGNYKLLPEKCAMDSSSSVDYSNWEKDSYQEIVGDYSKIFFELEDLIGKPGELGLCIGSDS